MLRSRAGALPEGMGTWAAFESSELWLWVAGLLRVGTSARALELHAGDIVVSNPGVNKILGVDPMTGEQEVVVRRVALEPDWSAAGR